MALEDGKYQIHFKLHSTFGIPERQKGFAQNPLNDARDLFQLLKHAFEYLTICQFVC